MLPQHGGEFCGLFSTKTGTGYTDHSPWHFLRLPSRAGTFYGHFQILYGSIMTIFHATEPLRLTNLTNVINKSTPYLPNIQVQARLSNFCNTKNAAKHECLQIFVSNLTVWRKSFSKIRWQTQILRTLFWLWCIHGPWLAHGTHQTPVTSFGICPTTAPRPIEKCIGIRYQCP